MKHPTLHEQFDTPQKHDISHVSDHISDHVSGGSISVRDCSGAQTLAEVPASGVMKKIARLKKINAVLAATILCLFLFHAVSNAFQLLGFGHLPPEPFLSLIKTGIWTFPACICVHIVLGILLTVLTLQSASDPQSTYATEKKQFWTIRVSGLVIAITIVFHLLIFVNVEPGPLRLHYFGMPQLVAMLVLVVALAIHILLNLKPLMVNLGIPHPEGRALDFMLVVSLLLLLMAVSFIIYYLRWVVL